MINGLNKVDEWNKDDYEKEYKNASCFSCPFAVNERQVTIHNDHCNFHTVPIGINKTNDNDITEIERNLNVCIGPYCMAYDIETKTCKRCNP